MNIDLHIEELVLEGFPSADRHSIAAGVERELTQLLGERGVPRSLGRGGAIASIDGGAFQLAPGSKAETIGAQVARKVYGGFGG